MILSRNAEAHIEEGLVSTIRTIWWLLQQRSSITKLLGAGTYDY
jgi:hypothetical protein